MHRIGLLIRAVFVCALGLWSASAFAASNYSENFDDGAQGWSAESTGDWAVVSSSYYTNRAEPIQTMATYTGDTWSTNYTYNVRIYSDNPGSGNRLGVVFGYVSDSNYYRVLINMLGEVEVEKVTNGSAVPVTGGSGSVGALVQNTWYPLQLVLTGNRLIVRVNNKVAVDNADITGITAGRIGFITQWNESRFDDLSVLLNTTYSQTFSGTALPSGWTAEVNTWNVTGGYLANGSNGALSIATYGGATPATDYTYRVRAYSDHDAEANTVGVVFSYQNDDDYYELVVNMLGTVTVNHVVNGQAQLVVTGAPVTPCAAPPSTCIPSNQFFDIELVRRGTTLSATVKGARVLNDYEIGTLPAGRIGVITRYNFGQFDDVLLVSPAPGSSANLLFKSGFNNTMTFMPPNWEEDCAPSTCFVDVTGTDSVTGFNWASPYLWGGIGRFKPTPLNGLSNPPNIAEYITHELRTVTGPSGTPNQVLYQAITKYASNPLPGETPQDPYIIQDMTSTGARDNLYIRFWMKLNNTAGRWRVLTQWKTGSDYRVSVDLSKQFWCGVSGVTPQFHWRVSADNVTNGSEQFDSFWEVRNLTVPVPLTSWFKVEFFTRRSTGSNGRIWVAINGQTIADYNGVTKRTGEITRVMPIQLYNDTVNQTAPLPIEQWVDDLEIWDGFPPDASPHDGSATPTWQTCVDPNNNNTPPH